MLQPDGLSLDIQPESVSKSSPRRTSLFKSLSSVEYKQCSSFSPNLLLPQYSRALNSILGRLHNFLITFCYQSLIQSDFQSHIRAKASPLVTAQSVVETITYSLTYLPHLSESEHPQTSL